MDLEIQQNGEVIAAKIVCRSTTLDLLPKCRYLLILWAWLPSRMLSNLLQFVFQLVTNGASHSIFSNVLAKLLLQLK